MIKKQMDNREQYACMCFWQIKNSFKGLHYPVKQNHQNYTYVNMYLCTEKIET
jgi:hypothetical protein